MRHVCRSAVLGIYLSITLFQEVSTTDAAPLTIGNILVSDQVSGVPARVREFTPAGVLVQTFIFPNAAGTNPNKICTDINGNIQVAISGFYPPPQGMTTVYPATGLSVFTAGPAGLSNSATGGYDGIGTIGTKAFRGDEATAGLGAPNGLVWFDINTFANGRFGPSQDYIDCCVGLDGLLYALYPGGSPDGRMADVFDPTTLTFIRTVNWTISCRSITVDSNGDFFAVSPLTTTITQLDKNGTVKKVFNPALTGFSNIDINASGQLVMGDWGVGKVLFTDRTLTSITSSFKTDPMPLPFAIAVCWVKTPGAGSGPNPGPTPTGPGEGSYPGGKGVGPGSEGTFGFGGGLRLGRNPLLSGPFVAQPGNAMVVNTGTPDDTNAGANASVFALLSVIALAISITLVFGLIGVRYLT